MRRPKDLFAGLIFICIGATVLLLSQQYEIGTARRMGPGYLPSAVSIILMAFGAWLLFIAWRSSQPEPLESHALAPLGLIVGAVVSFAVLFASYHYLVRPSFIGQLLNGRKYPQVGRICMDQFMVDMGEEVAQVGDDVILLGEGITAYDLAEWTGTNEYEVLTNISARVPRLYIRE